jgi:hypothetical protein
VFGPRDVGPDLDQGRLPRRSFPQRLGPLGDLQVAAGVVEVAGVGTPGRRELSARRTRSETRVPTIEAPMSLKGRLLRPGAVRDHG